MFKSRNTIIMAHHSEELHTGTKHKAVHDFVILYNIPDGIPGEL